MRAAEDKKWGILTWRRCHFGIRNCQIDNSKLSKWQLLVQPLMEISKWRHCRFGVLLISTLNMELVCDGTHPCIPWHSHCFKKHRRGTIHHLILQKAPGHQRHVDHHQQSLFQAIFQVSNIRRTKSQHLNRCSYCLAATFAESPWSQMLSRERRCSWSSADRRCSNYIWLIDNFIAY